jgi:hypothetical protein
MRKPLAARPQVRCQPFQQCWHFGEGEADIFRAVGVGVGERAVNVDPGNADLAVVFHGSLSMSGAFPYALAA